MLRLALPLVATAALALSACGGDGRPAAGTPGDAATASPSSLAAAAQPTPRERAALTRLREEEKLARDLYVVLAGTSGDRRFAMIARSEQRHMDAVGAQLTRLGIADPAAGMAAGSFRSAELQSLYDQLEQAGRTSANAAVAQGIVVERTDIRDIDAALPDVKDAEVRQALAFLRAGSERHLAAFSRS